MASFALFLAALLATAHIVYTLFGLITNICKARSIGLPYTFTLIHELEPWAYLTDPFFRRYCRGHLLKEQGWPRWARFMIKDWHYEDKGRAHSEYGPVFLVVSPGGILCYVADSHAALHIVSRRKAFIKPPDKMKMLELFGPNIGSADGDLWKVHSRIASPSFDEFTQKLVWTETQRQANHLRSLWSTGRNFKFEEGVYTLTLEVMGTVGFGQQDDNNEDAKPLAKDHKLLLLEALRGVIMHLPHILLIPKRLLRYSPWEAAYTAYMEMDQYMNELLLQGKHDINSNMGHMRAREDLLKAILRSSQENSEQQFPPLAGKISLTNEEIKGNLFIFLLAGYDTTANTIIYACIVLALYPDIQESVLEEIRAFHNKVGTSDAPDKSSSEYLAMFPYTLAFMYEILRVFPIIMPIARQTLSQQELTVRSEGYGTKTILLPGGIDVVVNNTAIHFSESYWPSPHIIEPRRWLVRDSSTFDPSQPPTEEQAADIQRGFFSTQNIAKGTFMTFSEGPRACLGRNFAKIEFVAFFSHLLQNHRLELGHSSSPRAIERDLRLLSGGSPVTLIPPHSVDVQLVSQSSKNSHGR
ncbi:cytochrome P450 [Xylariaceae sp. FL1651]|nr:cytochrome P450 [Xylariaceae sp. FL1651]